ncbi:claudin-16-like isoform X1 [Micropterus dolomieu]|uniref:claudin-16-like isoform X1 n=1 Tax=Micropterus dolomieu TaxID=147949 RepID=UPI001E8E6D2F|nr:claudin-16-like isoform X1 [Micropterus dolomieu]
MSRGQTEVLGLLIALTSQLLLIAAAGKDCWRHGAKDQLTSVGLSSRCRGLWGECVHDSLVGLRTCDVSVSYMEHLPADLLAMRIALLGMCVLSLVSILISIPGLRCTTLIPSVLAQGRLLLISGVLCLCGGVCGAAGLLWYGVETYTRYREEVNLGMPGITFEFGLSYWLMVGSVFCSLPSAVLTIRSVSHISDSFRMRLDHSQPAQTNTIMSPQSTLNCKTYI